jgi:hypothetical protein
VERFSTFTEKVSLSIQMLHAPNTRPRQRNPTTHLTDMSHQQINKRARSNGHNRMFEVAIKDIEKLGDIASRHGAKKQRIFHASEITAVTEYLHPCEAAEAVRTDEPDRWVGEHYPTVTFHGDQLHVVMNKHAAPIHLISRGKNLQAFSSSMGTMKQVFYDPNYEVHFHKQSMNRRMQFCARQRIGKIAAMREALDAEMADFNNELRQMKSNWYVIKKHVKEHFKAKAIVNFWREETQRSLCAPGGAGRAADAAAFDADFAE